MAAAPAIVTFISGTPQDAINATLEMYEITTAEHTAAARSPVWPAAPAMTVTRSPCCAAPRASTRTEPMLPEACGGASIGNLAVSRSRRVADTRAAMREA